MAATRDNLLVDMDWLEQHLHDSSLRIIDASVDIVPRPPGPSDYVSRYSQYLESHIPGATYLHMVDDLSDPHGTFPFALPAVETIWQRLSQSGISSLDTIVVYGNETHWATHRCWWVLAVAGADVRLLNTSFANWVAAGKPVESAAPNITRGEFVAQPQPGWVASKADVVASLEDPTTALVNSLSAAQFAGRGQPFGRPGRIPGSISVPGMSLVDGRSGTFKPTGQLARVFEEAGARDCQRLITYCGGGIAASTSFFALRLLGYSNVSLYDGSLLEWSQDPDLPLLVD